MKKIILSISLFAILSIGITGIALFVSKEKEVRLNLLVADKDIPALTEDSVAIVSGNVKEILPSRLGIDKFGDKIVFTDYVITVDNIIKGNIDKEIKIRTIGGSVGEGRNKFSVFTEDEPEFNIGERVLVFLSKNSGGFFDLPAGYYAVAGRFQGKYQIADNEAKNPKGIFKLNEIMNEINSTMRARK